MKTKLLNLAIFIAITLTANAQNCTRTVSSFIQPSGGYVINGTATLEKQTDGSLLLQLSSSFSTTAGPDLHVYLAKSNQAPTAMGNTNIIVSLLTSNTGAQSYTIPSTVAIGDYDYVLIHCKQYDHFWGGGLLDSAKGNCSLAGIDNLQNNNGIEIYPDPSDGLVTFNVKEQFSEGIIEVYDVIGQLILTESLTGPQLHLANFSNYSGVLYMRARLDNKVSITKFIIN